MKYLQRIFSQTKEEIKQMKNLIKMVGHMKRIMYKKNHFFTIYSRKKSESIGRKKYSIQKN